MNLLLGSTRVLLLFSMGSPSYRSLVLGAVGISIQRTLSCPPSILLSYTPFEEHKRAWPGATPISAF